jgi:hypothetical protein
MFRFGSISNPTPRAVGSMFVFGFISLILAVTIALPLPSWAKNRSTKIDLTDSGPPQTNPEAIKI